MANDNTVLSANVGTGDTIRDFLDTNTVKWPAAVCAYVSGGSAGAWALQQVDASHGLPVVVEGTATVSGTVTANAGSGTFNIQANASVNVNQVGGSAFALGQQLAAASLPVVLTAAQLSTLTPLSTVTANAGSGTFTVGGTVTANQGGAPWSVTLGTATSGGPTLARVKAASGTNATLVKNAAGQVYGWALYNNAAATRAVHVYDSSSAPTAGSGTPKFTILLPASGGANVAWPSGLPFASGIGYTITTGASDTDTGSCTADDVHGVLLYA